MSKRGYFKTPPRASRINKVKTFESASANEDDKENNPIGINTPVLNNIRKKVIDDWSILESEDSTYDDIDKAYTVKHLERYAHLKEIPIRSKLRKAQLIDIILGSLWPDRQWPFEVQVVIAFLTDKIIEERETNNGELEQRIRWEGFPSELDRWVLADRLEETVQLDFSVKPSLPSTLPPKTPKSVVKNTSRKPFFGKSDDGSSSDSDYEDGKDIYSYEKKGKKTIQKMRARIDEIKKVSPVEKPVFEVAPLSPELAPTPIISARRAVIPIEEFDEELPAPSPSKHAINAAQLLDTIRNELSNMATEGTEFEDIDQQEAKFLNWCERVNTVKSEIRAKDNNINLLMDQFKSFTLYK